MRRTPSARTFVAWEFYELLAELKAKTGLSFTELTKLIAEVLPRCKELQRKLGLEEKREGPRELTEGDRLWAGFVLSKDEEVRTQ